MNEVTPSIYKETGSFRHWCYKVLPLVYDDSLSYYELLCRVVKAIGDVISNMDGVRDDMDKLVAAYNELKKYVDTYFDSLDISAEVDKKLDEMAADGTLAHIINDQIFQGLKNELETKIKQTPFTPTDMGYNDYLSSTTEAIASYFAAGVGLESVAGSSIMPTKTAFVYKDGDKGYMGVLGQGSGFVYTDTVKINNVDYPVSYIDCSQFVSLITKCRDYMNSPYEYAFTHKGNVNKTTLREKCLELGGLEDNNYSFDFFNYIYTPRMAYIMDNSGNRLNLVSVKETADKAVVFADYVTSLKDGDLIFVGNPVKYSAANNNKRFLGIHHVAIYYKSLDLLNQAAAPYGITLKDLNASLHSEYGYIVHATGTDGTYANTLRINTLYAYANAMPTEGTRWIWSCRPYANSLNSNKARRAISYMFSEYNSFGFGLRAGNYNYIRSTADENDLGRMLFQQLSYNGATLPSGSDLNTIGDGYYRCENKNGISNLPEFNSTAFDIITIGTEAGSASGTQILVTANRGICFRKKYYSSATGGGVWGSWGVLQSGDIPSVIPKTAGGHGYFGDIAAGASKTVTIDFTSAGFTSIPSVCATLAILPSGDAQSGWSAAGATKLQISVHDFTTTSCKVTCWNNLDSDSASPDFYWVAVSR